ncbi:hypothetical protein TRVL_06764 [Trypanosoma vivax]|nr:hypothetical protein TRVL_06764 [Trypanosoma vivax]
MGVECAWACEKQKMMGALTVVVSKAELTFKARDAWQTVVSKKCPTLALPTGTEWCTNASLAGGLRLHRQIAVQTPETVRRSSAVCRLTIHRGHARTDGGSKSYPAHLKAYMGAAGVNFPLPARSRFHHRTRLRRQTPPSATPWRLDGNTGEAGHGHRQSAHKLQLGHMGK